MEPITGRPIRWGFVGLGDIANTVARDLRLADGGVLHAVAVAMSTSWTRCTGASVTA